MGRYVNIETMTSRSNSLLHDLWLRSLTFKVIRGKSQGYSNNLGLQLWYSIHKRRITHKASHSESFATDIDGPLCGHWNYASILHDLCVDSGQYNSTHKQTLPRKPSHIQSWVTDVLAGRYVDFATMPSGSDNITYDLMCVSLETRFLLTFKV